MPYSVKISMISKTVIVFILLSLLSTEAFAHKVSIFAWGEGGFIAGETRFSTGCVPELAEIIVEDKATGTILFTIRTDTEGKFRFKIPDRALENRLALRLIVKAGPGHRGEWLLEPEDYITLGSEPVELPHPAAPEPLSVTSQDQAGCSLPIDSVIIQRVVEDALDKKLAPLKRMLMEEQERGPQLSEIVAGIGYIFGFFGIFAYWKSRKKK